MGLSRLTSESSNTTGSPTTTSTTSRRATARSYEYEAPLPSAPPLDAARKVRKAKRSSSRYQEEMGSTKPDANASKPIGELSPLIKVNSDNIKEILKIYPDVRRSKYQFLLKKPDPALAIEVTVYQHSKLSYLWLWDMLNRKGFGTVEIKDVSYRWCDIGRPRRTYSNIKNVSVETSGIVSFYSSFPNLETLRIKGERYLSRPLEFLTVILSMPKLSVSVNLNDREGLTKKVSDQEIEYFAKSIIAKDINVTFKNRHNKCILLKVQNKLFEMT